TKENDHHQELSQEEQEKLLQKYDAESNTRNLSGIVAWVIFGILIAFSLFQLYTGAFGQLTAYLQRTIHLGFALVLIFFLYPARKTGSKRKVAWYDYILILLSIIVTGYWPVFYETLVQQFGGITEAQMVIGGLAILLVL